MIYTLKTCSYLFLVGSTRLLLELTLRDCCQSLWHIILKVLVVANCNSLRVDFHFMITWSQVREKLFGVLLESKLLAIEKIRVIINWFLVVTVRKLE